MSRSSIAIDIDRVRRQVDVKFLQPTTCLVQLQSGTNIIATMSAEQTASVSFPLLPASIFESKDRMRVVVDTDVAPITSST